MKAIDTLNRIRSEAEEKISEAQEEINTALLAYKLASTVCNCLFDFLRSNKEQFTYHDSDPINTEGAPTE